MTFHVPSIRLTCRYLTCNVKSCSLKNNRISFRMLSAMNLLSALRFSKEQNPIPECKSMQADPGL